MATNSAEYMREWRRANRDKTKAYRQKNADRRKAQTKQWLMEHPEKRREYQKRHAKASADYAKKWRQEHPEKVEEYKASFIHRHPRSRKAWDAVRDAKRAGKIKPSTHCETCGKMAELEAHHTDYSKPLDVAWLCRECHAGTKEKRMDRTAC